MKILVFILLAVIFLVPVFAQVSFMPADAEVLELKRIYTEAGYLFPSDSYPLAKRDLVRYAEKLLASSDTEAVAERVEQYLLGLSYEEGKITIGSVSALTYERYFRSREEWEDLYRLYLKQAPLVDQSLYCIRDDLAALYIQAAAHKDYFAFTNDNFCGCDISNFEYQMIQKGIFRYFVGPLEVEFGRNRMHYGPAKNSSLLISQRLPFLDALRLRLSLGPLQMDCFAASLENREAVEDVDLSATGFAFEENVILCTMHRFSFAFKRFGFAIAGMAFLARERNGFQLGDFFPVFSWHNANVGVHNLSLVMDGRVVPVWGLELFGQLGFDDINAAVFGIGDADISTIWAYIVGGEYSQKLRWGTLCATVETGGTHYLWGSFHESDPLERGIYRLYLDRGVRALPMTSPHGPGSFWLYAETGVEDISGAAGKLFVELINKNTAADLFTTTYEASEVVKQAYKVNTIQVGLDVSYSFRDILSAYLRPAFLWRDGVSWWELTLGASARGHFRGNQHRASCLYRR